MRKIETSIRREMNYILRHALQLVLRNICRRVGIGTTNPGFKTIRCLKIFVCPIRPCDLETQLLKC